MPKRVVSDRLFLVSSVAAGELEPSFEKEEEEEEGEEEEGEGEGEGEEGGGGGGGGEKRETKDILCCFFILFFVFFPIQFLVELWSN